MRRSLLLIAVAWCFVHPLARGEDPFAPDPIAKSGNALLLSMDVNRKSEGRDANRTVLRVRLFFAAKSKEKQEYLLRLADLKPIEDDTSALLSTPDRLDRLAELHEETRVKRPESERGEEAPTAPRQADRHGEFTGRELELEFDAPVRRATSIKLIKGKAILSKPKLVAIGIPSIASFNGARLEDPKLKDFELKATVRVQDGTTDIRLQAPRWSSKLVEWGLAREGKLLPEGAKIESVGAFRKLYAEDATVKGTLLALVLREGTEPEEIEFEFKDVPLP